MKAAHLTRIRVSMVAAARPVLLVLTGSAITSGVLAGADRLSAPTTSTSPFMLAWALSVLAGLATGMVVYFRESGQQRRMAQLLSGDEGAADLPGGTTGAVISGLLVRARAAEATVAHAVDQAQQAAAGMAAASSTAVTAEESVRAHLVAELHDTVAQSLVLGSYCEWDDNAGKADVLLLVRKAEQQLRDIMAAARPPELTSNSLAEAVTYLVADYRDRWTLNVDLSWESAGAPVPYSHAVVVYRFIQEALANTAKHAGVSTAQVSFTMRGPQISVEVRDRGAGFDPDVPRSRSLVGKNIGLDMMRRRARMLNGTVTVVSAPGTGTSLRLGLTVPELPDAPPAAAEAEAHLPFEDQ